MVFQQSPEKAKKSFTNEYGKSLKVKVIIQYNIKSFSRSDELNIQRQVTILGVSRAAAGPDVHGCRPVLVTFQLFKDRFDVLTAARCDVR